MTWLKLFPGKAIAVVVTVVLLMTLAAGSAWRWQANSYGGQLSDQALEHERQLKRRDALHAAALGEIGRAAAAQERRNQEQRLLLEQQLQASSQNEYRKLTDAEKTAARLRDRLATAELRLSVLVANPAAGGGSGNGVPTPAGAGCLVDGAGRADIDPGAAQRVVGIANRGDRAIIALTACQAYVEKVAAPK
ncbi:lysis protein [Pseudomonas sp. WHRI 8822A]|uniref:lysis protein n=1 Tax=Pseudomonas sp. WHRI 8822A TaxID=3162568 RepID=UPI0032EC2345